MLLGFVISCSPKKSKEPAQLAPQIVEAYIHYIRITESNTDTLPFSSEHQSQSTSIPFFIKENDLYIEKGLSKSKLLIEYVASYEGKGREFDTKEYFIFNELPAELKLNSYDISKKEVLLKLLDSMASLEDIRYLPPKIEFKEEEFKMGEKKEIFFLSQKLGVKKELLEPTVKGQKVDPKNLKTKIVDFGEVEFSTKLELEYKGHFTKATVF